METVRCVQYISKKGLSRKKDAGRTGRMSVSRAMDKLTFPVARHAKG